VSRLLPFSIFPPQASTLAPRTDHLLFYLLAMSGLMSVLIAALIFYFSVRYRRRPGNERATQVDGSNRLEIAWSVVPLVIFLFTYVWGANVFFFAYTPPPDALELYGVGKQWMWKFQHLSGQREINELHVPVGRNVKVIFTSEDVLHDLFIPAFRVKADAVPGRYSAIWFNATRVGEYHLFCAEYCGTNHSGMIGTVYVMQPNDYQTWLSSAANASLSTTTGVSSLRTQGEHLFTQLSCATCHVSDGSGKGPSLVGVYGSKITLADGSTVNADEDYLRESILNSQRRTVAGYQQIMPTFQGIVTEEDLASLIEYIKSTQPAPKQVAAAEAK